MLSKIILSDGTVLYSGDQPNAILSATITQCVNDGTELMPGSVCSAMLETELFITDPIALQPGMELEFYRDDTLVGLFTLDSVTHPTANRYKFTAFDRVSRLDRDLTQWLASLADWPYSLYDLAWMVCAQCGLALSNTTIPNGDHPIPAFTASGVTGRQLMQWIAQAAGQFCRATAQGKLEFAWYRRSPFFLGTHSQQIWLQAEENLSYGWNVPQTIALFPSTQVPAGVHSVRLTHCGSNVANIFGFSAQALNTNTEPRYTTNSYGTTISSVTYGSTMRFSQSVADSAVDAHDRSNGCFCMGFIHPFVTGQTVTVSFNLLITDDPLKQGTVYIHMDGSTGGYAQSEGTRYWITLPMGSGGLWFHLCGCSGIISNIQVQPGNVRTDYSGFQPSNRTVTLPNTKGGTLDWTTGLYTDADGVSHTLSGRANAARDTGNVFFADSGVTRVYYPQTGCFQNAMQYADYEVMPADQVIIRQSANDVGVSYPASGSNPCILQGNPLLVCEDVQALTQVAKTLYTSLHSVIYTPCTLKIPGDTPIFPGDLVRVTDRNGRLFTLCVMKKVANAHTQTLSCTGSYRRDCASAAANAHLENLKGKVLELSTTVDGLKVENRQGNETMASMALTVDGIQTQVMQQAHSLQEQTQQMTALQQDASALSLTVESLRQEGTQKVTTRTGYRFDDTGLHITASGSDLQNAVTEKGMYVIRGNDTVMLRADADGVLARNVTVENYLIIGDHARLEDYTDGSDQKRTACFFIGG